MTSYLRGESYQEIAKHSYRSTAFCKNVIENVGVPSRVLEDEPWKSEVLPDACIRESFAEGDIAWSAKYHAPCIIEAELSIDYQAEKPGYHDVNYENKYSSKAYKIYVLTKTEDDDPFQRRKPGFCGYALAYDLGSLEHLKEYGIDLSTI